MTTSPQEPPGPVHDPDIDPAQTPPVTDPDTVRPDVQPSPAGGDPLTADPGSPPDPPD
ncbi:MAG: hypothetical protein ACR2KL_10635 [Nocardioidaceae bacterium]